MKQNRLMILGASTTQLPIIFKAVEMGHYVITVDNVPDNIGHQFSHQSIDCSTVDHHGVCKIAEGLNIDGIVTFASDIATTTVSYVAASLKLQGCELIIAEILSNKANFRLFQQKQTLNHPGFFISQTNERLSEKCLTLNAPLIFKPIDTSGSRGITKIDEVTTIHCQKAFAYAQQFSVSEKVSVEEFVEGVDVSGDGFLINGQLCAAVSQKYKQGFTPIGHRFPTNISDEEQASIFTEVSATCRALDYTDGPIDFDVKITNKQVVIIEMSPRLGGNGIPELIRQNTQFDLIEMTLHYALGETCVLPENIPSLNGCGSWIFGSKKAGKIRNIASLEEMKAQVEELIECRFNDQIGDEVSVFEHSGNSLGYAIFDCSSDKDYHHVIARLESAMQLNVIGSQ